MPIFNLGSANGSNISSLISLVHSKNNTVHSFTGLSNINTNLLNNNIALITFIATADYNAGDSILIDGITYTLELSTGEEITGTIWKSGTVQTCTLDLSTHTMILNYQIDKVPVHNIDEESHQDLRLQVTSQSSSISRLENILINDVTGNPFLITFEDLDGLEVTGTWNQAQARLEF